MSVICLIPARQGSEGIKGKNFRPLAGISPVERAVTVCLAAGYTPYVSSDGENRWGWPFWIQRSAYLSQDITPMSLVVYDFLKYTEGPDDQIILLVQPTQPLRERKHLHAAVAMLDAHESVASVVETEPAEKLYRITAGGYLIPVIGAGLERRQDAPRAYRCDGTVYGFRRAAFLNNPDFRTARTAALIIPPEESAPLDTPLDWLLAEDRLILHGVHTRPPYCPCPSK